MSSITLISCQRLNLIAVNDGIHPSVCCALRQRHVDVFSQRRRTAIAIIQCSNRWRLWDPENLSAISTHCAYYISRAGHLSQGMELHCWSRCKHIIYATSRLGGNYTFVMPLGHCQIRVSLNSLEDASEFMHQASLICLLTYVLKCNCYCNCFCTHDSGRAS